MLEKSELDQMIEHEKRRTALEYQHEAWVGGLSDGIEMEIMAEAAIETALTELVEAGGESAALAYLDEIKEQVVAGAFGARTLQ